MFLAVSPLHGVITSPLHGVITCNYSAGIAKQRTELSAHMLLVITPTTAEAKNQAIRTHVVGDNTNDGGEQRTELSAHMLLVITPTTAEAKNRTIRTHVVGDNTNDGGSKEPSYPHTCCW